MGAYSDRVIADGASYYWRLGELSGTTAVDAKGLANGTISGGVTLGTAGAMATDLNTAMTFDGVDDKIQTVANVAVPLVATIEGWMRFTASGVIEKPMFSTAGLGGSGDRFGVGINGTGSAGVASIFPATALGAVVLTAGSWCHLAFVFDGSSVSFYVNGAFDRTQAFVRTTPSLSPCTMGWNTGAAAYAGTIDEVAIYPRALTAEEIAAHYALRSAGLAPYPKMVVDDGASNYWRLGETSGLTAVDLVGGANGTISGGVTLGVAGALSGDLNKAMTFDGATGKIVTATAVTVAVSATIEGWIKTTQATGTQLVLSVAGTGEVTCGLDTGKFYVYTPSSSVAGGATTLSDGQWHHVVFVLNGTTVMFYRDALLDGTAPAVRAAPSGSAICLGAHHANVQWWNGALDDVAIYPRALTAQEIAGHYLAGRAVSGRGVPWLTQVGGDEAMNGYNVWAPMGSEKLTVSGTVKGLTPAKYVRKGTKTENAQVAIITVEGADVRWTLDGTAPVGGSIGHLLPSSNANPLVLNSADMIRAFKAIRDGGTDATLQVSYLV